MTALCGSLYAQDLNAKVTTSIPASRINTVMEQLTATTGVPLMAAANLRDDVLLVSVKDVTVQQLMAKLAEVENGAWVKQGNGFMLERDLGATKAEASAELATRKDLIKKAIASLPSEKFNWSQDQARRLAEETVQVENSFNESIKAGERLNSAGIGALAAKTPYQRAIIALLKSLDVSKLAQIPLHGRAVFSTNSTRMQWRIEQDGTSIFRDFIVQQEEYVRSYKDLANQPEGQANYFSMGGFSTPALGNGNASKGLGLGLLIFNRDDENSFDVHLIAADPALETIASGSYRLDVPKPEFTGNDPGSALSVGKLSEELAKALNTSSAGGAMPRWAVVLRTAVGRSSSSGPVSFTFMSSGSQVKIKLSDELRRRLMQPDKFDPLSFGASDLFTGLAAAESKNIVALLPDETFRAANELISGGKTTTADLKKQAPNNFKVDINDEADWIIAKPIAASSSRLTRVDRKALGALLAKLDKQGYLRLDDLATFAASLNTAPDFAALPFQMVKLVDTSAADRDFGQLATGNFHAYKLYGLMTPAQRQAVWNSGTLQVSNLTPEQLDVLTDYVYNSFNGPSVQRERPRSADQIRTVTVAGNAIGGFASFGGEGGVRDERTIVLPDGIPRDAFLRFNVTKNEVMFAFNSQNGSSNILDAAGLGFARSFASKNPEMGMSSYDRFRPATRVQIGIEIMLAPGVSMGSSLTDASVDLNKDAMTYEQLPEDFRKKAEDAASGTRPLPPIRQKLPPPAP